MSAQQARRQRQDDRAMTLPSQIEELLSLLRSETSLGFEIDQPSDPNGDWWLDLEVGGMPTTVSWRKAGAFGVYTRDDEDLGIGGRPDEIYREPIAASRRLLQLSAKWRASASRPPLALRDVRHLVGETQSDLARSLGIDQAGVSRLEQRSDLKVSTLQDYVAAMGGVLELRVRFPSFEAPIAPVETPAAKSRTRSPNAA